MVNNKQMDNKMIDIKNDPNIIWTNKQTAAECWLEMFLESSTSDQQRLVSDDLYNDEPKLTLADLEWIKTLLASSTKTQIQIILDGLTPAAMDSLIEGMDEIIADDNWNPKIHN